MLQIIQAYFFANGLHTEVIHTHTFRLYINNTNYNVTGIKRL